MAISISAFLDACPTCATPRHACHCLYDVRDPSAFVHDTINQSRLVLTADEHTELHAEGMAILVKLAGDYKPQMDGYEQEGRFSGYAAMFLPRKLGDAWHRMHPEHWQATEKETGKRRWHYGDRAVSLEAIVADDPDRFELLADRREQQSIGARLHRASFERWTREVEVLCRVGELLGAGATPADVAHMLGLTPAQVRDVMAAIAPLISQLESDET